MKDCFSLLTYKHFLLLSAYQAERSKAQAHRAINYEMNENLSMGRHVLPYTQQLIDWGFIVRTNPNEPRVRGHKHLITNEGRHALDRFINGFKDLSIPNPDFGY